MNETKQLPPPAVKIKCCDCGIAVTAAQTMKPKELAKAHNWKHAGTGQWRCPACADMQN